jgi:hypothetical protein
VHLPGPEEEDGGRNTLTLKNLSEALQLLTAPSVCNHHQPINVPTSRIQAEELDSTAEELDGPAVSALSVQL